MVNGSRRRTQTRRPRKTGGGGRFTFGSIVWAFLLLAAIFAFYQIPAKPTVPGLINTLIAKSEWMSKWTHDLVKSVEGGLQGKPSTTPGSTTNNGGNTGTDNGSDVSTSDAKTAKTDLAGLTVAAASSVAYRRTEWRQWDSVTGCWNVREQVLATQAMQDKTLTLLDKNGNRTTNIGTACSITAGTWLDPYTNTTLSSPKALDIDHLVPLGYVAAHGGQAWSTDKKAEYANDYKEPGHLLAVSASANRQKGDKGPAAWKPSNRAYWCAYAVDWVRVSHSWQLSVTDADKNALTDMLATCKA